MNIESNDKKTRILCNSCGLTTWHLLLFSQEIVRVYDNSNIDVSPDYSEQWEVFQCMGCEEITIREAVELPWEEEAFYLFFPERTGGHHGQKQYQRLPKNLQVLYGEVVNAINKNSLLLCAAGLRALLEGLCENQGIKEGPNGHNKMVKNLEGKINGLISIVPAGIVKNLHGLRFLGNQALHELETPSKDDLELALTVVEDIFNIVYDLNYKSQLLYDKVTRAKPASSNTSDGDVVF
jgi:hypothetical protein